jgi:glycosyltransferase involved in cell wall biosynthesis
MMPAGPDVTVIIPVYNSARYLPELLESLRQQDIGASRVDVIAVNDGSTDGSGTILDEYCARHPGFRAIHQDNSKRPGRPRNTGLRQATGRYVFFADADDVLAASCLRKLVEFADEHQSDVVIPRLSALAGRTFPTAVYERTLVDVDLPTAFGTLFPQKLYRRQMLVEHQIWFPEGRRLDDGMFNAQAYLHAKRLSIVSDDDYYYLRARPEGGHLSQTDKDATAYTQSVADLCGIVRDHLGTSEVADDIVLELYRRKCLVQYEDRYVRYDEAAQDAWIAAHRGFVDRYITPSMEAKLASPYRERAYFVRRGDRAGLLALKASEQAPVITAVVNAAAWSRRGLDISMDVAVEGRLSLPRQLLCTLRPRGGEGVSGFPLVQASIEEASYGAAVRCDGCLPHSSIETLLPGHYDVHVVSESASERLVGRVRWSTSAPAVPERGRFVFYSTKGGHGSARKSA